MQSYEEIIAAKERYAPASGFDAEVNEDWLFPFQRHIVRWALAGGRRAVFADTGLGKSRMQLAWADRVARHTGGRVLILAPLAVGPQTVREAATVGLGGVVFARSPAESGDARIVVSNYDNLDKWDGVEFAGVVLDESSILKSYMGATKRALMERFADTPFKLAATATPAPNDHLELGNHAEWLGILSSHQMIARWFINDSGEAGKYRLKGHAVRSFWDWVASWAICVGVPSDIGPYADDGYVLPALRLHRHIVQVDLREGAKEGALFRLGELSATSIHRERRITAPEKAAKVADLVLGESHEPWLVWCDTNYEAEEVTARLGGAAVNLYEVAGDMHPDVKSERLLRFAEGRPGDVLLTKPKIAGFGMNYQRCARCVFMGTSYSYEAFYQTVRRVWRFGQLREVDVHVVLAVTDQATWDVVSGKAEDHAAMKAHMFAASRRAQARHSSMLDYHPTHRAALPSFVRTMESP